MTRKKAGIIGRCKCDMEVRKNRIGLPQNMVNDIANASQQRYSHIMFVCICNAIKEEDLREVARHGVTDPEAAYAVLGKTPQCRVCLDHAEDVMCDERSRCAGRCPARSLTAPGGGALAAV